MPYILIETRFLNGDIRIEKCFSLRYGKKCSRGGNVSGTPETQKEINARRAKRNREDLIINNFSEGDIWASLTYPRDLRPDTPDAAHKTVTAFMKKIKRKYPDVKYFLKTETGETGNHHHHMFFSWGGHTKEILFTDKRTEKEIRSVVPMDEKDLKNLWREHIGMEKGRRGGGDVKEIYNLSNGELLEYFGKRIPKTTDADGKPKEYLYEKYSHSRNLKKPVVVKKVISNKSWRRVPRPRKGYEVTELWNGTDAVGFEKQTYVLRKRC